MADPYLATVERYVKVTAEVPVDLRELSIIRGDNISPSVITINFAVIGDNGIYETPYPEPLVITDSKVPRELAEGEPPNPMEFLATTLRTLILDAVMQKDDPIAQALGMAGLPIREAGKMLLNNIGK